MFPYVRLLIIMFILFDSRQVAFLDA